MLPMALASALPPERLRPAKLSREAFISPVSEWATVSFARAKIGFDADCGFGRFGMGAGGAVAGVGVHVPYMPPPAVPYPGIGPLELNDVDCDVVGLSNCCTVREFKKLSSC